MDNEALFDTRDYHGISMWVILETNILLVKCNGNVRPLGFNVGSLDTHMWYPSLGFFSLFLVAGFKARAPSDRERKIL
jgi:hypothetical protein